MSVTFTVRIPKKLAERMKKHSEINWSEVVRRSIESYLEALEEAKKIEVPAELLERLKQLGVTEEDLEPLPFEEEVKLQERMRKLEWRRVSSTIRAQ